MKVADDVDEITAATRRAYDTDAANYADATRDFDRFPGLIEALDCFGRTITSAGPVLDLGCGAGRDSDRLSRQGLFVVAADVSVEMLAETRSRCAHDSRLLTVQLDMVALPFRTGIFAGVWACASLLHVHSRLLAQTVGELFRVLECGALAAISMKAGDREGWVTGTSMTSRRWFNLVRPDHFAALMAEAGFVSVTTAFSGRRDWFVAVGRKPN